MRLDHYEETERDEARDRIDGGDIMRDVEGEQTSRARQASRDIAAMEREVAEMPEELLRHRDKWHEFIAGLPDTVTPIEAFIKRAERLDHLRRRGESLYVSAWHDCFLYMQHLQYEGNRGREAAKRRLEEARTGEAKTA